MSEVFKSTVYGSIPLSFTGRRLLQNLRVAFGEYVDAYVARRSADYTQMSRCRGDIAKYISQLEANQTKAQQDITELRKALADSERRLYESRVAYGELEASKNELPPAPVNVTYNLPPIPPGYSLAIVGGIICIEPFEKDEQ